MSGWPETQPSTQEVQTISIDTKDTESRFRVGLSGVYTSEFNEHGMAKAKVMMKICLIICDLLVV